MQNQCKLRRLAAIIAATVLLVCCSNPGGNETPSTTIYTVSFDTNGGSGTAPAPQTARDGSVITLPDGQYMSGTAFIGWNTNADGTGTNYNAGSSYKVTGDVTLYGHWTVTTYTVTFDTNGGSGMTPVSQRIQPGNSITLPDGDNLSLIYASFTSWNTRADGSGTVYTAGSSYMPAGNIAAITLYAQWGNIVPFSSVEGFENKLAWLELHAQSDTSYTVEASADESISPKGFNHYKSNITITLTGVDANRTISLSSNGPMFFIGSGVTLILDDNITLVGRSSNNDALVRVWSGTLKMNTGSAITNNTCLGGGGVSVLFGTFIMSGGTISGNTGGGGAGGQGIGGGGVYVADNGTFTMSGGTISDNTAHSINNGADGGGVYVDGTFTMSGGTISGNTADEDGGGVYVSSGAFTMSDGEISGNTASYSGGGVYSYGTFTMSGGKISGNTASYSGGGVYISTIERTFTMSGGEISGNTAGYRGGGVYVLFGIFIMSRGTISSNTSGGDGGGVYVDGTLTMSSGTISGNTAREHGGGVYASVGVEKTGGTIYGYSAGDTSNSNVVKDSSGAVLSNNGHAVYVKGYTSYTSQCWETTAGPEEDLYF